MAWGRGAAIRASRSTLAAPPAGLTVSLWLGWTAARVSEPSPELACLSPAKHSLPVAMEVGKRSALVMSQSRPRNPNVLIKRE